MSNHEIEDVLSSIRRLVSEDLRPTVPRPTEDAGPVLPSAADKLILTPALRVVMAPEVFKHRSGSAADGATAVEDVVARLGAAVAEDEWESPLGDPEVWSGAIASDPVQETARGVQTVSMDDAPDFGDAPMAAFTEVEDVLPEPPSAAPEQPSAARKAVTPPQEDRLWADAAEAEVRADLERETAAEVMSGLYEAKTDGMAFDEVVLRDLVRDLIREELSGTLGERITRNVRKLVRAEIARAVALREFD